MLGQYKLLKKGFSKPVAFAERKMQREDSSKVKSPEENAEIFLTHFENLYARVPEFDPQVINLFEQKTVFEDTCQHPSMEEIGSAIGHLKDNAPGKSDLMAHILRQIILRQIRSPSD